MKRFEPESDHMTAEDWKKMYLILFRVQTEILEQLPQLSPAEISARLQFAAQNAEEYYISR